jgi:hypothetical protein
MPSGHKPDSTLTSDDSGFRAPSGWPAPPAAKAPWSVVHTLAYSSLMLPSCIALALWLQVPEWQGFLVGALLTHMALVLTFLGGIHWGIAMRYMATDAHMPVFHIVWGPVPGYIAWFLLMAGAHIALLGLMALTLAIYWVDRQTWPGSGLGRWLPLRSTYTLITLVYSGIALVALSL